MRIFWGLLILLLFWRESVCSKLKIGMSNVNPLVFCETNTTNIKDGVEYQLFLDLAREMGWESDDYQIYCLEFEDMLQQTLTGNLNLSIGGITITASRLKLGYKFSQPTFDTGSTLLLKSETNNWFFVTVFELLTGIAIVASTIIVGFLLYFFEGRKQSFFYYMWHAWAQLFFICDIKIVSVWSRLIQVIFWFTILILASTYTATMAAILTNQQTFRQIHHLGQIYGQKIAAGAAYENIIKNYGALFYKKEVGISPESVSEFITDNDLEGIVFDDIQGQLMVFYDCSLYMANRFFNEFDYGIIFSPTTDYSLIGNISTSLTILQRSKEYDNLIKDINSKHYSECGLFQEEKDSRFSQDRIRIRNIKGLWYILFYAILFAFILHLGKQIYVNKLRNQKKYYFLGPYAENDKDISSKTMKLIIKEVRTVQERINMKIHNLEQYIVSMEKKHGIDFSEFKLRRVEPPQYKPSGLLIRGTTEKGKEEISESEEEINDNCQNKDNTETLRDIDESLIVEAVKDLFSDLNIQNNEQKPYTQTNVKFH